ALYAHANVGQILFLRIISLDPVPTLFPYTTLFRSRSAQRGCQGRYPVGGLVRMLRGASFAVAERALARRPAVSALYSRAEGRYRGWTRGSKTVNDEPGSRALDLRGLGARGLQLCRVGASSDRVCTGRRTRHRDLVWARGARGGRAGILGRL